MRVVRAIRVSVQVVPRDAFTRWVVAAMSVAALVAGLLGSVLQDGGVSKPVSLAVAVSVYLVLSLVGVLAVRWQARRAAGGGR